MLSSFGKHRIPICAAARAARKRSPLSCDIHIYTYTAPCPSIAHSLRRSILHNSDKPSVQFCSIERKNGEKKNFHSKNEYTTRAQQTFCTTVRSYIYRWYFGIIAISSILSLSCTRVHEAL